MNLTVRTIARYENDSPPKGDALKRFVQLADEAGDQEALDAFACRLRDDFGREAADSIRGFREAVSRAREVLSQLKRRDSLSVEQARKIGVEADSILEGLDDEMEDVDIHASAGAWNQPILPGLPVRDDDEKAQAEPIQAGKAPEDLVALANAPLHEPMADQAASVHTNAESRSGSNQSRPRRDQLAPKEERGQKMNGTITKRALSNGRPSWGYVFDAGRGPDGKRIQVTKSGYETKGEASDALRDAIAEYKAKTGAATEEKANPTLAEFFAVWMGDHASRSCAPKTVERYGEIGQYFIRELGQTRINELKTAAIQSAIYRLSDCGGKKTNLHPNGRPLAPKTVRHIGTLLYTCLSEADRLGIMTVPHPMANKRVKLPKLIKRKPCVIDSEKLTVLFERARSTRLFPFVVLGASTGCRRGELLALTWSDLNLDTGEVSVSKSLEQTKKGLRVKSTKSGEPREFVVSRIRD